MTYTYLDDVAIADAAFTAEGASLDEVFAASADATMNVMVEDLSTIRREKMVVIQLEHEFADLLLFSFLNELVYFKDAKRLLLRPGTIKVREGRERFTVSAEMTGEEIDPARHPLRVDVKAVTLHLFALRKVKDGWEATVVLDI